MSVPPEAELGGQVEFLQAQLLVNGQDNPEPNLLLTDSCKIRLERLCGGWPEVTFCHTQLPPPPVLLPLLPPPAPIEKHPSNSLNMNFALKVCCWEEVGQG